MKLELRTEGFEELKSTISGMSAVEWEGLKALQGAQLLNRSRVITPVKSGELRLSANFDGVDTFGYTKEYAPHVEYGHRVVRGGRQVGYAEGRHFLEENVRIQEPIYTQDVMAWLKRRMK